MKNKHKEVKAWAVIIWNELQNVSKYIYQFRHEALNKQRELTEEQYHCTSCDCDGLDRSEVKVIPITISYSLPTRTNKNKT